MTLETREAYTLPRLPRWRVSHQEAAFMGRRQTAGIQEADEADTKFEASQSRSYLLKLLLSREELGKARCNQ